MAVDPRRPLTAAGFLSKLVQSLYANAANWYASLTGGNLPSSHLLVGGVYQVTPQTITDGQTAPFQVDAHGNLLVTVGSVVITSGHVITDTGSTTAVTGNVTVFQPTGTSLHTVIDSGTITAITDALPAGTNNIGQVQQVPGTSGGLSYSVANPSANSNNKTQAKGSAGQVYSVTIQNIQSVPVYLKMFDKTSANVTAGTTACDYQFMCPANATAANGAGIVLEWPAGLAHANGITWLLTTGISATDNTSVAANSQLVTIGYK